MVVVLLASLSLLAWSGGCASGSNSLLPSKDKNLCKPKKELLAEAAQRSFPAEATSQGEAPMRAEIDYGLRVINIVNLSEQSWNNVQVWVNGEYACQVTALPVKRQVGVNFEVLYNKQGQQAPLSGVWVNKAQLVADGKVYDLKLHLAD